MGRFTRAALLLAGSMAVSTAAQASSTFDFLFSGNYFGNNANFAGQITFDETQLPALASNYVNLPSPLVSDIHGTVTGATSGNGDVAFSSFTSIYFWTPSALDLSTELVGQDLGNGHSFGEQGVEELAGDFNLFGSRVDGNFFFDLGVVGSGEHMALVSLKPAVPEPASWALMIAGFGLAGAVLRRSKVSARIAFA